MDSTTTSRREFGWVWTGFSTLRSGDKGIPRGVGKDGRTIQLAGGGVIRIRPDGTDLEVVSTGECNPRSVVLSATDEIFTFGTDDDSKKWPNSLTHHIVGGHFGYPYQFLTAALPIAADHGRLQGRGSRPRAFATTKMDCPPEYRGNLFFCDWGNQTVDRFEIRKAGGTYAVSRRSTLVSRGSCPDFHPFSLAVSADGSSLWMADWAFAGWLADGQRTGRLFRLSMADSRGATPEARPNGQNAAARIKALDHPALAVRMESQRSLMRDAASVVPQLVERLNLAEPETGRIHALWALDGIGGAEARKAIESVMRDASARVRLQAARSAGIGAIWP